MSALGTGNIKEGTVTISLGTSGFNKNHYFND
jgi:sugar (pentulose or hexulose) kinase